MTRSFLLATMLVAAWQPQAWAQQQPAMPVTVRSILKTPPRPGQLVQVSGTLVVSDNKAPALEDIDKERRVVLDFSKSQVAPDKLGATLDTTPPVMVIARMSGSKESGKPVLTVIGAVSLTP